MTIGRGPEARIRLADDDAASKIHASLSFDGMVWRLRDENSANGTFADGRRITSVPLEPGSYFVIGQTLFWFFLDPSLDSGPPRMVLEFLSGGPARGPVLIEDSATLGRGDCTISLDDDGVSREHCKIVCVTPVAAIIRDLGSSHGTFVNGTRVPVAARLKFDDEIRIGSTVFLLRPEPGAKSQPLESDDDYGGDTSRSPPPVAAQVNAPRFVGVPFEDTALAPPIRVASSPGFLALTPTATAPAPALVESRPPPGGRLSTKDAVTEKMEALDERLKEEASGPTVVDHPESAGPLVDATSVVIPARAMPAGTRPALVRPDVQTVKEPVIDPAPVAASALGATPADVEPASPRRPRRFPWLALVGLVMFAVACTGLLLWCVSR